MGQARGPMEALRTGGLGEAKLELGLGRGAQDLPGGWDTAPTPQLPKTPGPQLPLKGEESPLR